MGGLIGFFTGTISNSSSTGSVEGGRWFGGLVGRSRGDEIKSSYSESNVLRRFTSSNVMGGLIGDNYGTLVRDSYASGNVEGRNDLGGLIGINYAEGTILNSYSNSKVTGYSGSSTSADRVGGLVGNNQGEINNSQAYGDVNSQGMEIGGLVGINSGNIFDSQAEGNISTDDNSAGGLVGNNQGIIETSTSSGNVSSDVNSGGFAGNNSGQIINSYSLGDSGGNKNVGGFIGKISLNGEVKNCFSTGLVTGSENIGGLIGINEEVSNITGSYWDIEQTGQSDGVGYGNSSDSKGLTTSQMTGPAAKDNMSAFDWAEKWVTTDSYPALSWE